MNVEIKVEFVPFSEIAARHKPEPSGDWLLDKLRSLKTLAGTMERGPERDAFARAIQETREAYEKELRRKARQGQ